MQNRRSTITLFCSPAVGALAGNRVRGISRPDPCAVDRANVVAARLKVLIRYRPEQRRPFRQVAPAALVEEPGRILDERLLHALLPLHRLQHVSAGDRAGTGWLRDSWNAGRRAAGNRRRAVERCDCRETVLDACHVDEGRRLGELILSDQAFRLEHVHHGLWEYQQRSVARAAGIAFGGPTVEPVEIVVGPAPAHTGVLIVAARAVGEVTL